MCSSHRRIWTGACLLACLVLMWGCGDFGSGGAGPSASYQIVSGVVSKGPISGATVTVYQLVNGRRGAILGTTTSQSDGTYTLTIPATSGPVVVVVSGNPQASYLNESNPGGPRVAFTDPTVQYQAAVPEVGGVPSLTVSVTPVTDAAVQIATSPQNGGSPAAIQNANATLSNLLGVDIVSTVPTNIVMEQITDVNSSQDRYGAYLAGIQAEVTATNTVQKIVTDTFVKPVLDQQANLSSGLGSAGATFLASVNSVVSDPNINPTGIYELPNVTTIQGAINAPIPVVTTAALDTTPPAAPTGLTAILDISKTVKLSWTASTSGDTTGYIIYRNGGVITEVPSSATGYYDLQVADSTTYGYTVRAFDAARNISTVSNTATVTLPAFQADTTPPSQPLALFASLVGTSSVTITWEASTDNVAVAGYTIFRNSVKIATVAARPTPPNPSYTDTQVSPNTLYRYQVRAFDAAGNVSLSGSTSLPGTPISGNELVVVTEPLPNVVVPPSAPTGLAYTSTTNSVTLTWTSSASAVGYRVYRNGQPLGSVTVPAGYPGWPPAYTDATVAAKTSYGYTVEAFDALGNSSAASGVLTATTQAIPVQDLKDTAAPSAPAGLLLLDVTVDSVSLIWTASTDNVRVAGYNVYRVFGGSSTKVATVVQPGYRDSWDTTVYPANTRFSYSVEAFDPSGNISGRSNVLNVDTPPPPPPAADTEPPTIPAGLSSSGITENSVSLIWTASTDNTGVVKYEVYRNGTLIGSPTAPGVTDAGLEPGTTYTYKVRAIDAAGNPSLFSPELSVTTRPSTDVTAPTTPTGLVASSITTTSLTLSWLASTDNVGVVRYDVYRDGVFLRNLTGGLRSFTDTALTAATAYRYKVQAFDAAGNGSLFSTELSVSTGTNIVINVGGQIGSDIINLPGRDITPPQAPTNLTATTFATSATTSSVVLAWVAAIDAVGVTGYDVYRNGTKIATVSQPGYTDTGVNSGTTYDYLVVAFDAAGNRSPVSNQLFVTPNQSSLGVTVIGQIGSGIIGLPNLDFVAPTKPTNLAAMTFATSGTQSSAVLTWSASIDLVGVAGYDVYRNGVKIVTVSQPGYTDSGLVSTATYSYYVVAFDLAGNRSVASDTLSVKPNQASLGVTVIGQVDSGITGMPNLPILDVTAPTKPTNLAAMTFATTGTQSSVVLTWNAPWDLVGVTGYDLYRNGTRIATVSQPGYTDTGVPSGATYSYTVVAFDAAGNRSLASDALPVTPNQASLGVTVIGQIGSGITGLPSLDTTAPTKPANLLAGTFATSGTQSSVILTWDASTDAVGVVGYDVYRSGTKIATVSQTGYTNTNVPSGTTYSYTVVAFDAAGNRSLASDALSVTPNQTSLGVTVIGQIGSGITGLPSLDYLAPTKPSGLSATTFATSGTQSSAMLMWVASSDQTGVAGYDVYRNGVKVATVSQPGYTDGGLLSGTTYSYTVVAFDAAGNRSLASDALLVTPNQASLGVTVIGQIGSGITGLPVLDITAPTKPSGLAALTFATSATQGSVVLTWSASSDLIGVSGYDVYRNGAKIATVQQPGYTDAGVPSGTTYGYTVVAFDLAGNRSVASDALLVTPNQASLGVTVVGQVDSGITGMPNLPVPDTTAPTKPSGLAATTYAVSGVASTVVLTWSASTDVSGVSGYDVYRNGVKIATVPQPGYTNTGVPSGATYSYYVIAFDPSGNRSVASDALSVTPNQASLGVTVSGQLGSGVTGLPDLDVTAPTKPSNLLATAVATSGTTSSVVLTWDGSWDAVGVSGYDVYRNGAKIVTVSKPGYTDSGVLSGSTYSYTAVAFDAAGNRSVASDALLVTPNQTSLGVTVAGQLGSGVMGLPDLDVTAPTKPSNLAAMTFATSGTRSSVVLTWSGSTDAGGVAGYEVYRNGLKIVTVAQTGYTDANLLSGSAYSYSVVAYDLSGNRSVSSDALSVTPNQASLGVTVIGQLGTGITGLPVLDVTPPTQPGSPIATTYATSGTTSTVVLTWGASTDVSGVAGYELYRNGVKIVTVTQPGYTDAGVLSASTYSYFVIAYDASGNRSAASDALSVTPNQASLGVTVSGQLGSGVTGLPDLDVTAPTKPANLSAVTAATSATTSAVVLSWNASWDAVGVSGYDVYRGGVKIATVPQPGYTDTGVSSGSSYAYTVVAYDAAGNRSVVSDALSVTPNQASLGVTVSGQLGLELLPAP